MQDGTERRRGRVTVQHPQIRVAQVGLALSVVAAMTGGVVEGSSGRRLHNLGYRADRGHSAPTTTTTTQPPQCRPRQGFWLSAATGRWSARAGPSTMARLSVARSAGATSARWPPRITKGYWEVAANGVVSPFGDATVLRPADRTPSRRHRRDGGHRRRRWATGWSGQTGTSTPSATPTLRPLRSVGTSRSPSWPSFPPQTTRATGWSEPQAPSTPSATPPTYGSIDGHAPGTRWWPPPRPTTPRAFGW